jgi:hypothetical protein
MLLKEIAFHVFNEIKFEFRDAVDANAELRDELKQLDDNTWCIEVPFDASEIECQQDVAELLSRYGYMEMWDYTF